MKTIKIIDLLNKIANEEIPKKIKINNCEWEHDGIDYKREKDGEYLFNVFLETTPHDLNMEVEILEEEKKIPEKLGYFDLTKDKNEKDENGNNLELHYTGVADTFDDVYEKINEIIDYLDYLKSKGDE